jgi:hypothetical protein
MKIDLSYWQVAVIIAILVVVTTVIDYGLFGERTLPRCNEDVVLMGKGSFLNGRWSEYECGPALDDFAR